MTQERTVTLPPLGSFLIERFLDCRYSNPEDAASKATSTHLGARIAYHIASHTGLYIMRTYDELAELFCVSPSAIKSSLGGLRKVGLITVENTHVSRVVDGKVQFFRGGNVTQLVKPSLNWYCQDKYIVNESTARAVVRARAYALKAMFKKNPDLYFDCSFIATGELKFYTAETLPDDRADFCLSSGRKRSLIGLKTTQHKGLNKDLLEVLKKENYIRPDQGVENKPLETEISAGDQVPEENEKNADLTNETKELTQEPSADRIQDETPQEDQAMKPRHPKLGEKAKRPEPTTNTAELAEKLATEGRVKPDYRKQRAAKAGNPLEPTNKKGLAEAIRLINRAAVPHGTGAPHYSHTNFVEGLAKRISSLRNERAANYPEAIKMVAFALKNYAAYYAFLSQGTSQSINANINLKVVYRAAYYDDMINFVQRNKSRYASFCAAAWADKPKSTTDGPTLDREPKNAVGAPPELPTKSGRSAANGTSTSNTPKKSSVVMNDIAAEILGGSQ
ncbi:hypothetical protein [Vibrio phage vB_ValS_PJ32]|nr:hypothetical protein [Vibrio phage vB_ValS_PJ32]